MTMRVCILLGGLIGPDGPVVSPGMIALGKQIKLIPGTIVTTHNWSDWQAVSRIISASPASTQTCLIGYSGGGSRATYVANAKAQRAIDLMVLYDPSPQSAMQMIKENVKRALCYYNERPGFFGLGGGLLRGPHVELISIGENHLAVQNDVILHRTTLTAIRRALV